MAEDGTTSARSEATPQPAPNPDAQATVNDFLDYTEFFPSDLVRSLRLIGNLDSTYQDATLAIHDLTTTYGGLPNIPTNERPNPAVLRQQIATALERAIYCRESTYTEASRLYEVAERHCRRLSIIKTKLQALPQPPSRDPTPVPVSPQASRALHRGYERFDRRHVPSSAHRQRDRSRKSTVPLPRGRSRVYSVSDSDSGADSDARSPRDIASSRVRVPKERPPKPSRARAHGGGTNVHSGIAGISTSNALARLSPPPPNARPGSKYAPWLKLTEYEMAVLRKQMKKNAVWTPSETMVKRELEKKKRGQEYYEKEKARCAATGEEFLDEEPEKLNAPKLIIPARTEPNPEQSVSAHVPVPTSVPVPAPAPIPTPVVVPEQVPAPAPSPLPTPAVVAPETIASPVEQSEEVQAEETMATNGDTAKRDKREEQREQAMRDAQDLEDAGRKIREAAESLKDLIFAPDGVDVTPSSIRRRSAARASNKRKREASPHAVETPTAATRETSFASQDSGTKAPDAKRPRTLRPTPSTPAPVITAPIRTPVPPPSISTSALTSPIANATVTLANEPRITTIQIPLAPAGPSTPNTKAKSPSPANSNQASPTPSPTTITLPLAIPKAASTSNTAPVVAEQAISEDVPKPPLGADFVVASEPMSASTQSLATAASSRPRRESVAPLKLTSPPPTSLPQAAKIQKASTPEPGNARSSPIPPIRPRSRGIPTPKAQSEEPKQNDASRPTRELRRHSIFSQSALGAPTRMSTRRKPPPKGDITAGADGQKTVTNVQRAQGSKNKKKKKADEEHTEPLEEIDPDEPRYCICDDVSFGQMISCDNNCDREWFHLDCVKMSPEDIPSRRSKWYCPECRVQLGVDAYGKEIVAPPLPGRRGNR